MNTAADRNTIAHLTSSTLRGSLVSDRVGSLVQACVRTEVDADGNPAVVIVEADRDDILAALMADGSPFYRLVPEEKKPHAAMRAAVTRSKKGQAEMRAGDEVAERLRWTRVGVDSSGVLKCTLREERPDPETGRTNSTDVVVVKVDKTGGTEVEVLRPDLETGRVIDTVNGVLSRYKQERRMLHADDVRGFVNAVLDECKSVHVGGSLHFLAYDHDETFATAERALVVAGYSVLIQPVTDGSAIASNVSGGLLTQVARLSREVRNLKDEWEAGRNVQLPTFDAKIGLLNDLGAKADLFKDMLGEAHDEMRATLDAARKLTRDVQMSMLSL